MARGIFISYICDIYDGESVVGKAVVETKGLYYRIECTCGLPQDRVFRIFTKTSTGEHNLGVCIPKGAAAIITTNVSIRKLGSAPKTFYVVSDAGRSNEFYELSEDIPFLHIDELQDLYFCRLNGKCCLKRLSCGEKTMEEDQ